MAAPKGNTHAVGHGPPKANRNAVTHGAFSLLATGELPVGSELVERQAEIRANLASVEGIVEEQQRLTANLLLAVEMVIAWVREEGARGRTIAEIALFKALPKFGNSAGRNAGQLFQMRRTIAGSGPTLDALLSQPVREDGQDVSD